MGLSNGLYTAGRPYSIARWAIVYENSLKSSIAGASEKRKLVLKKEEQKMKETPFSLYIQFRFF